MQLQSGDIIFEDSDATGAKIVKFLMTAPNMYVHLWRKITNTQQVCEYYHPTLVISDVDMIEQQWKVQITSNDNINHKKYIVFRPLHPWSIKVSDLVADAKADLGQKWGIIHTLLGRFPTWLTGIPYFARYVKLPNEEVSAGRVARWIYETYGITFGYVRYTEATTNTMVRWLLANPDKFEVIEKVG